MTEDTLRIAMIRQRLEDLNWQPKGATPNQQRVAEVLCIDKYQTAAEIARKAGMRTQQASATLRRMSGVEIDHQFIKHGVQLAMYRRAG